MKFEPRYSGKNRSGVCVCGHSWEDHHCGMVMNAKYYKDTKEPYVPQECEYYGFNEDGGLDENGNDHCHQYKDSNYGKIGTVEKIKINEGAVNGWFEGKSEDGSGFLLAGEEIKKL